MYIMLYIFCSLKFAVYKIDKTAMKNFIDEEYGQSKIKNLNPLKELFLSNYKHFMKTFFQWIVILLSNKTLSEIFL